jgi:hypothetical protein
MEVNLNIQEQEHLYYFYHNWASDQKNKIHLGSCGYCKHGTGMHKSEKRGKSGVWIGPFSSLDLCHDYIINRLHLPAVEPDKCCN